jgi:hypothetical protein
VDRKNRLPNYCHLCSNIIGNKGKFARVHISNLYFDTPWDECGEVRYFCSHECQENYERSGDFDFFYCQYCDRMICEQNPSNGWHVQYRWLHDEQICLKCYEEYILEEGIDIEHFINGEIPGMFFSYGNTEPKEKGYEEVEGYTNFFIRTDKDKSNFCKKAVELIQSEHKVVVGYENMAIGGLEGFVTLFAKKEN